LAARQIVLFIAVAHVVFSAMKKISLSSIVVALAFLIYAARVEAQQAIFLVRHADTAKGSGDPDVPLSEAGERRALTLAKLLKNSGINVIYTTGMQRTVKTAEPLAKLLAIEPKQQPQLNAGAAKPNDIEAFANLLRTQHRQDILLVVLHSNSGPALIKALGHPAGIKIPETEFDNLFVITSGPGPESLPTVLRLRY
jgi:phosphohistidine phosphatase SixA